MTKSSHRQPSASVTATDRNRREAATVDWLIDRLAVRLGDRNGGRHAPPWEPRQEVLLGVLEPVRVVATPAASDSDPAGDSALAGGSAPAAAETVTQPSGEIPSIGLDFRLRTAPGATSVELDLDVAFSVYLEDLGTLEEQRSYLGSNHETPEPEAGTEVTPDGAPASAAVTPVGDSTGSAPAG